MAEHNIGEKEVMLYDLKALERHDYTATRAERLQNAKHWVLRLNADGPQKPLRQRPEFAVALKQCFKLQDAHLTETQQSLRPIRPEHQQRQRPDHQFEGGENFDYFVDRKTGWRCYRDPRWNPSAASSSSTSQWKNSQWQTSWSSWQPASSEKRWWFRFLGKNSSNSTGCVDRTPTHNTHLCSTVCAQARTATTRSSHTDCSVIFVRLKIVLPSGVARVSSLVDSLAYHYEQVIFLIHSSFYHDTGTRTTIGTTRSTPRTPSASSTSPRTLGRKASLSRTTLAWKTSRVAETCATLSHRMRPKKFATKELSTVSRISRVTDPYPFLMDRKNLEKNITEVLSSKKWRNLEKVGHTACRILKCQRRPTSNRTFTSTIP